jgi:LAGLIDADG DNA endonuclease family protein
MLDNTSSVNYYAVRAPCEPMFVWTSLDSEREGGFAAGLIAGDGHFAIQPNNGGTTWQCHLAVCLRADDTPLLAELCRWSGAGMLQAVPVRRTSRPQTTWIVQRQADCLRMVSILDRYPLLGKKLGQYEIWREAVVAWTGPGSDRHAVLAQCSERLRAHRRPDVRARMSAVSITDDLLLAFLAGFATAEAHFGATSEGHPHFQINLRRDDGKLLRVFRDRLGLGRVVDVPPYGTSHAAVSWRLGRLSELRALTQALDRYPPRGRVLSIYEAWRELVLLEDRRSGKRRPLATTVKERRAYRPGHEWTNAVDPAAVRRRRHIAVLQAWEADTDGPRNGDGVRRLATRVLSRRATTQHDRPGLRILDRGSPCGGGRNGGMPPGGHRREHAGRDNGQESRAQGAATRLHPARSSGLRADARSVPTPDRLHGVAAPRGSRGALPHDRLSSVS